MSQGIRTILGYTNNYPSVDKTSLTLNTLAWNTIYHVHATTGGALTFTIPTWTVNDGAAEIHIVGYLPSGQTITTVTPTSTLTLAGTSNISENVEGAEKFEISLVYAWDGTAGYVYCLAANYDE